MVNTPGENASAQLTVVKEATESEHNRRSPPPLQAQRTAMESFKLAHAKYEDVMRRSNEAMRRADQAIARDLSKRGLSAFSSRECSRAGSPPTFTPRDKLIHRTQHETMPAQPRCDEEIPTHRRQIVKQAANVSEGSGDGFDIKPLSQTPTPVDVEAVNTITAMAADKRQQQLYWERRRQLDRDYEMAYAEQQREIQQSMSAQENPTAYFSTQRDCDDEAQHAFQLPGPPLRNMQQMTDAGRPLMSELPTRHVAADIPSRQPVYYMREKDKMIGNVINDATSLNAGRPPVPYVNEDLFHSRRNEVSAMPLFDEQMIAALIQERVNRETSRIREEYENRRQADLAEVMADIAASQQIDQPAMDNRHYAKVSTISKESIRSPQRHDIIPDPRYLYPATANRPAVMSNEPECRSAPPPIARQQLPSNDETTVSHHTSVSAPNPMDKVNQCLEFLTAEVVSLKQQNAARGNKQDAALSDAAGKQTADGVDGQPVDQLNKDVPDAKEDKGKTSESEMFLQMMKQFLESTATKTGDTDGKDGGGGPSKDPPPPSPTGQSGGSTVGKSASQSKPEEAGAKIEPPHRRAEMKVGKYDGRTCFDTFLMKFVGCAQYNGWSEADKLAHLRNALEGNAQQLLISCKESLTFGILVEKLKARYGSEEQRGRFRQELQSRKQRGNESLQELALDIDRLSILAFPDTPQEILDSLCTIETFLNAMTDEELSFEVRKQEPKSLREALTKALRLEMMLKARQGKEPVKPRGARGVQVHEEEEESSRPRPNEPFRRRFEDKRGNDRRPPPPDHPSRDVIDKAEHDRQVRKCEEDKERVEKENENLRKRLEESEKSRAEETRWRRQRDEEARPPGRPPAGEAGTAPRGRSTVCFNCQESGHFQFNCPNPRRSQAPTQGNNRADQAETVARANGTHTPGATTERAYLPVAFGKLQVNCLVDTGCEVTLFPAELVDPEKINPTRRRVLAVNGTEIAVLGNTTVTVMIGGRRMEIEGLVTKYVFDPILGIDWLVENNAVWRFKEGTLEIRGQKFNLMARKSNATWARCVSVVSDTTIADGTANDVSGTGRGRPRPVNQAKKSKNARRREKRRREVKLLDDSQSVKMTAILSRGSDDYLARGKVPTAEFALKMQDVSKSIHMQYNEIQSHQFHSRSTPRT
jgi:predicted aspartyl protease